MTRIDRQRWVRIVAGESRSPGGSLLLGIASAASLGYRLAVWLRNLGYRAGLLRVRRAHVPVISVGNLTTGGTGKTPMVMHLAERLRAMGHAPAVLMRGYMPDADSPSDEAALYGQRLADVPVIVDPDRVRGAATAKRDHPAVDVLILDDGFQHRRIARDLNLVLIDAAVPWGYGRLLPRGLMREPRGALRRADGVVLTHCEQTADAPRQIEQIDDEVKRWHGQHPIAHASHAWATIVDATGRAARSEPAGKDGPRVVAFCGLGHPAPFFAEAKRWCHVVEHHAFDDHQRYDADFADWLSGRLAATGADAALTSEKDWARLAPVMHHATNPPPIWRATLELRFAEGPDAIDAALAHAIAVGSQCP